MRQDVFLHLPSSEPPIPPSSLTAAARDFNTFSLGFGEGRLCPQAHPAWWGDLIISRTKEPSGEGWCIRMLALSALPPHHHHTEDTKPSQGCCMCCHPPCHPFTQDISWCIWQMVLPKMTQVHAAERAPKAPASPACCVQRAPRTSLYISSVFCWDKCIKWHNDISPSSLPNPPAWNKDQGQLLDNQRVWTSSREGRTLREKRWKCILFPASSENI